MSDKLRETVGPVAGPAEQIEANEAGRRALKGLDQVHAKETTKAVKTAAEKKES